MDSKGNPKKEPWSYKYPELERCANPRCKYPGAPHYCKGFCSRCHAKLKRQRQLIKEGIEQVWEREKLRIRKLRAKQRAQKEAAQRREEKERRAAIYGDGEDSV